MNNSSELERATRRRTLKSRVSHSSTSTQTVAEMRKAEREQLGQALCQHLNIIYEIFQTFEQTPASSLLEKISWKEVIQMAERVSKEATTVGMLYTGEVPEVKALEENMASYFNILQGFLFLSHGSASNAGPTLLSFIQKAVRQVVDTSFMLLQEAISSYGLPSKTSKHSILQRVGAVWESCSALKKTPATNVTAIGRAMAQVAVSMKDVLREMKELKPASSEGQDEASDEVSVKTEDTPPSDDNDSWDADLCNELSPEEMKIVHLTADIVSEILAVIKELIRSITALLHQETSDNCAISVDSLEKLLKLCQEIGVQVDELGACLYPPQEISAIKVALEKISRISNETETELINVKGHTEDFGKACTFLRNSLRQLGSELGCPGADDIVPILDNLVLRD